MFEINRNFRNEGLSTRHNPEFTMLEFYQAYADYRELMDLTEVLLRSLAAAEVGRRGAGGDGVAEPPSSSGRGTGSTSARPSSASASATRCFAMLPGSRPATSTTPIGSRRPPAPAASRSATRRAPERPSSSSSSTRPSRGLIAPTFITHYPTEVSPLSRRNDDDPEVADRFELFIGGREIANGFSELNDPDDQAERFRDQARQRSGGDDEAMVYDEDYVTALEYGMPPTAGEGIGIDRLVMLFTRRRLDPRRDPVPSPAPGRSAGIGQRPREGGRSEGDDEAARRIQTSTNRFERWDGRSAGEYQGSFPKEAPKDRFSQVTAEPREREEE